MAGTAKSRKPLTWDQRLDTRGKIKSAIRALILQSEQPELDALHLRIAISDADKARMRKDRKDALDPPLVAKAVGIGTGT